MDDESFSNFFKKLREEGDFELEVPFEGGGDSGWIRYWWTRKTVVSYTSTYVGNNVSNVRKLPGWEINEGSQGGYFFDHELEKINKLFVSI